MKKILSMILVLLMLLTASAALADGMLVQVTSDSVIETEPVSLDNIELNVAIELPGSCVITATSYEVVDSLGGYSTGGLNKPDKYVSGKEADYAMLRFDILNTSVAESDYLSEYEVKVVSDDLYEFVGWAYQYDYDKGRFGDQWTIPPEDNFAIDPMYVGHYVFGCTLPNAVINATTPLRMEIKIGENELTYHIRK